MTGSQGGLGKDMLAKAKITKVMTFVTTVANPGQLTPFVVHVDLRERPVVRTNVTA